MHECRPLSPPGCFRIRLRIPPSLSLMIQFQPFSVSSSIVELHQIWPPGKLNRFNSQPRASNQIKSNQKEIKSKNRKSDQIKSNQIKSNQIKSNQIKSNQIKSGDPGRPQCRIKCKGVEAVKYTKVVHFSVIRIKFTIYFRKQPLLKGMNVEKKRFIRRIRFVFVATDER